VADIPAEAVQAAAAAFSVAAKETLDLDELMRAVVEAAAPFIAEHALRAATLQQHEEMVGRIATEAIKRERPKLVAEMEQATDQAMEKRAAAIRADERARIVAWLRELVGDVPRLVEWLRERDLHAGAGPLTVLRVAADAIGRGAGVRSPVSCPSAAPESTQSPESPSVAPIYPPSPENPAETLSAPHVDCGICRKLTQDPDGICAVCRFVNDEQRATAIQRAEQAEAALARVKGLHSEIPYKPGFCYCANPYPCPTIRALDGAGAVSEEQTGPVRHLGGNAEDCPACDITTMPYPFLCPGEERTPPASTTEETNPHA
jgi:hypothetical protein